MQPSLIKNDTAQQKSAATLTLIHAVLTPPCMDLLVNMHRTRQASPSFLTISKQAEGDMTAAAHLLHTLLKASTGNQTDMNDDMIVGQRVCLKL